MTDREILDNISVVVDHLSRLKVAKTSEEVAEMLGVETSSAYDERIDKYIDANDTRLAKIIAAATAVANRNGEGSLGDSSAYVLASVSDDAVARIRTARDLVNGKIDIEDVSEHLVDRAVARMIVFTEHCIKTAETFTKNVISAAVTAYCPEAMPIIPTLHGVVSKCSQSLGRCVRSGIRAVASAARPIVRAVAKGARSICRSVVSFLHR